MVVPIICCIISSVEQNSAVVANGIEDLSDHTQNGRGCIEVLIQLISSGSVDVMLEQNVQRDLVSKLMDLPYLFLVGGAGCSLWKQLLNLIIGLSEKGQNQRSEVNYNLLVRK